MPLNHRRFIKVKNAKRHFLCALCRAPRQMRYDKHLSQNNYLQIITLSAFITWCLYPFMGINAAISLFVIWPAFEMINKFLYRKELPCPYCGFDPTWYRRDVRIARQKVTEFWSGAPMADKATESTGTNSRPTAH